MALIAGLALGAGIGSGLAMAVWGLFPPRRSLQARLEELHQGDHHQPSPRDQIGRAAAHSLRHLGLRSRRTTIDLRVAGHTVEQLAAAKVALLVAGVGLPVGGWVVAGLAGVWIAPLLVPAVSVLTAGGLFVVPDLVVRERARRRRRELRHHLCAFLDLVGLRLSGGSGMEQALTDSAAQGHGWGFVEIQRALQQALLANEPPWTALEKLGRELGARDLEELAAWLLLAGTTGSRVRTSLHVKARGLRERALHEAETAAQQATERMSLPVVLMFTGFLGLVGYPAVAAILGS
ncbi:type II secretion system F family protein [Candidatus Poriferisocius sp.]|uniref:type II secretion system F family protein n=1 Tax=Candidatus Poriferisocius sp. TaxID=3101276 RepID=UPI003B5CCA85